MPYFYRREIEPFFIFHRVCFANAALDRHGPITVRIRATNILFFIECKC